MSSAPSLPADFRGPVRLFPLPNLVLFPHVVQPLHIFEPRYRELMADALADDRLITLATLRPGWEPDYHQRPPIYPIVCVGRVLQEEHLPDGRYNLLLHGLSRARVVEELPPDKAYRTALVELCADVPVASVAAERELRQRLGEAVAVCFAPQPEALGQFHKLLEGGLPLGTLCDIFSFALTADVEVKQRLLAEIDVGRRTLLLLEHLKASAPAEPPPAPKAARPFPPPFSVN